ncbi:MAG: glycerophosphodiester phosphodiesterase [Burkholderiales bacterium]|nr:glycerophosphodiester phosphodiesterase [Burkholderiales bacterium]
MIPANAGALDIQGHRGARGLRPENTLPAFAHALSLGVTTLELDAGITRDGVVVVSHDPALNPDLTRGPDGRWLERTGPAIRSLAFDALAGYDVGRIRPGSAYAKRFPEQRAVDGTRIPRLADLFAMARRAGNTAVRFNIETKLSPLAPDQTANPEEFSLALIRAVREAEMASRTAIQSFDWRTLAIVQREAPEIPTVCLTARQDFMDNVQSAARASPWNAGLHVRDFRNSIPRMVKAAGGAVWSPYYREITAQSVKEAQALGLKVIVWTVNEPGDMRRMIALGVDGIISDYPDRLRPLAGEAGIALPAPTPVQP